MLEQNVFAFQQILISDENTRYLIVAEDTGHSTLGKSSERVPSLGQTSQQFSVGRKGLALNTCYST